MAKKATKLEDIGDERDQKVFLATVKAWFAGNLQAALDKYNEAAAELEAFDAEIDSREPRQSASKTAEVNLRFKRSRKK